MSVPVKKTDGPQWINPRTVAIHKNSCRSCAPGVPCGALEVTINALGPRYTTTLFDVADWTTTGLAWDGSQATLLGFVAAHAKQRSDVDAYSAPLGRTALQQDLYSSREYEVQRNAILNELLTTHWGTIPECIFRTCGALIAMVREVTERRPLVAALKKVYDKEVEAVKTGGVGAKEAGVSRGLCSREGCCKPATGMCQACGTTVYCGESCGRSDWATHSKVCGGKGCL